MSNEAKKFEIEELIKNKPPSLAGFKGKILNFFLLMSIGFLWGLCSIIYDADEVNIGLLKSIGVLFVAFVGSVFFYLETAGFLNGEKAQKKIENAENAVEKLFVNLLKMTWGFFKWIVLPAVCIGLAWSVLGFLGGLSVTTLLVIIIVILILK